MSKLSEFDEKIKELREKKNEYTKLKDDCIRILRETNREISDIRKEMYKYIYHEGLYDNIDKFKDYIGKNIKTVMFIIKENSGIYFERYNGGKVDEEGHFVYESDEESIYIRFDDEEGIYIGDYDNYQTTLDIIGFFDIIFE